MRVFVTGLSGFVGGHLTEHLTASGDLVVGISTSGQWPDSLKHLSSKVRLEAFNLIQGKEEALTELLNRKQPEVIYHLAAQSNPQRSFQDPRATWSLNLGGALNLLESVRQSGLKPRVVLVSSGVCYGNPASDQLPVRESCPLLPNNPYSASKAAADLLGLQHYLAYGTNVVIVRPFNHSGPRQSESYVLGGLSRQVAEVETGLRRQLEVGNLDVVRDFTDVRDVVRAYRLLAIQGAAGQIYNLGSGHGTRVADALDGLLRQARCPVSVHVDPARMRGVDQPLLVADSTKLEQATGWRPTIPLKHTLADMLQYWRDFLENRPKHQDPEPA